MADTEKKRVPATQTSQAGSGVTPEPNAAGALDLSIVVVGYEMARELPRTLLSLLRPYQRGLEGVSYEIILLDNGSKEFPPDLPAVPPDGTVLHVARATTRSGSPVGALNEGLGLARGRIIGAWIDGARLASPGLLAACLKAAELHPDPVIATQNYHLGAVRHAMASEAGHDAAAEDALLHSISWPEDGYRLFGIATPEMTRPDGPMLESNGLFLRADLWRRLGGFDPAFDEVGGGMANPDMLRRAVEAPGTELIRLLGEGTFHQVHGGLTTSSPRQAARATMEASKRYAALRGCPPKTIRQPGIPFHSPIAPASRP